ncbi:hypothetical protein MTO96_016582 [Rhipicephalus appendiculatus]
MAGGVETLAKQGSTFEMGPLTQVATRRAQLRLLVFEATPLQHLTLQDELQTLHGGQREARLADKGSRVEPRDDSVHVLDHRVNTTVVGLVEDRCVPSQ